METTKVAQKSALGKGLASLLPGAAKPANAPAPAESTEAPAAQAAPAPEKSANSERHLGISLATVDDIHVNPYQPRREFDEQAIQELSQSLRMSGMIQPIVVRKTDKGYELIAGERRLRAAKMAGMKQVPIVIRRSTDRESLELALVENIQRRDLNCVEEALAYLQLMQDFNLTQEEVAKRVGKERATVANHLRLLKLPEAVLEDLKANRLTFGHGKALLTIEDSVLQNRLRDQVLEGGLSVRETERLAGEMKAAAAAGASTESTEAPAPQPKSAVAARLANLAQELTRHLSTKVEVKGSERRGKIILHYASRDELERILSTMQN